MGNLQVRFLEGWAPAMAPGYSTLIALRQSCPSLGSSPCDHWLIELRGFWYAPVARIEVSVNRCLRSLRWSLHQQDQGDHAAADNAEILEDIDITQDAGLCLQRSVDNQNRFGLSIGHSCSTAQQVAGERTPLLAICAANRFRTLDPIILGSPALTLPPPR